MTTRLPNSAKAPLIALALVAGVHPARGADLRAPPPDQLASTDQVPLDWDGTRAVVTIDESGTAVVRKGGLRTELDPIQFYLLVGRGDLAQGLSERLDEQRHVVFQGVFLTVVGVAALIADLVYVVNNSCVAYGDDGPSSCGSPSSSVTSGLGYGGLAGLGLGLGFVLYGGLGIHPDGGGVEERRALADQHNGGIVQASNPGEPVATTAPSPSRLATLRAMPIAAPGLHGLALGISF